MKRFIDESWLVLVMGVVFALLLAGTQQAMMPKIQANQEAELAEAITHVVPGTETFEAVDIEGVEAYRCKDESGELVGWAVVGEGPGFIDTIRLVAGLSPDKGTVLAIKVIQHLETPGLGNKIESVPGNDFPLQFNDKPTGEELKVVKTPPKADNEIKAITGATYSSGYVTDIVNQIMLELGPQLPAE